MVIVKKSNKTKAGIKCRERDESNVFDAEYRKGMKNLCEQCAFNIAFQYNVLCFNICTVAIVAAYRCEIFHIHVFCEIFHTLTVPYPRFDCR